MRLSHIFSSSDARTATVKKNGFYSLLIKGCSIVIQLMLVPLTLDYVSGEVYGLWLTLSSIILWLGFFDIGLTLGLKNKLTIAIAENDWVRAKQLVSTSYWMMAIIFLPVCVLLLFVIPHIPWSGLLNVSDNYERAIAQTMSVVSVCFCLQMTVNVLGTVAASFQETALSSLFPVLGNFLSLIGIIVLKRVCPPSLLYLGLLISTMPIIVVVIASIILYKHKYSKVAPSIKSINRRLIKDLFDLGIKFFIIKLQLIILYQFTNFLISNVSGPIDVANYNVVYKYLNTAVMLLAILLEPLWPAITEAYTKKDFAWIRNIYNKMSKIVFIGWVVIVLMVIMSPIVYKLWIGDRLSIPWSLTIIVGIYMILSSWDGLQVTILNGTGKIKIQTIVTLFGLSLHIPLSLLLGKQLGSIGVVSSMIIITSIYILFFTIQARKIVKNSASGIWNK